MSNIELKNRVSKMPIAYGPILEEAKNWLKKRGYSNATVEVVLVGVKKIRTLNKKFLNRDRATDVLSFPLGTIPGEEIKVDRLLGTVFICYDIIEKQAKQYGISAQAETIRMLRHGIDHLVGIHHK